LSQFLFDRGNDVMLFTLKYCDNDTYKRKHENIYPTGGTIFKDNICGLKVKSVMI